MLANRVVGVPGTTRVRLRRIAGTGRRTARLKCGRRTVASGLRVIRGIREHANSNENDTLPVAASNGAKVGLAPGEVLTAGQTINSPNGRYRMVMQGDGNLVLYVHGKALWSSVTNGNPGAFVGMQGDGNLVVYSAGKVALWASGTDQRPGSRLYLQDDGNAVIYEGSRARWASNTVQHGLPADASLEPNESVTSPDDRYRLIQQGDGNLVLYSPNGRALWATGTDGNPGARTVMQSDGNLVVYSAASKPLWNSVTAGQNGARLEVQNDANLVVYNGNVAKWASYSRDSRLAVGEMLLADQSITSAQGKYKLLMQADSNLVLYGPRGAIWSTNTVGRGGTRVVLQGDGNLVIYRVDGVAIWASNTVGTANPELIVQDDGNLVMYSGGRAVWNTGTNQGAGVAPGSTSVAENSARRAEARIDQIYTNENRNSNLWSGWCETFAALVYENRFRYGSAIAHFNDYRARGLIRGGVPPRGAIVFWALGGNGHVAISVGGGNVIGTTGYEGERKPVSRTSYTFFRNYVGWALPY